MQQGPPPAPTGPPAQLSTPTPAYSATPAYLPLSAVMPTDAGAVWAFVMGILSWFTCPLLGVVAFFVGGSAVDRIRASRGNLRGDGLAHAGRALGCLASSAWLLALIVLFGACSLGVIGAGALPSLFPSPTP